MALCNGWIRARAIRRERSTKPDAVDGSKQANRIAESSEATVSGNGPTAARAVSGDDPSTQVDASTQVGASTQVRAYVAKIPPLGGGAENETCSFPKPRSLYGGEDIAKGDEVYLWFSEMQDGNGLSWRAIVEEVDGASLVVRLGSRPVNSLGKVHLEPFRDDQSDHPLSGLAKKLYKHAHNKVAALSATEAEFLRGRFAP